MMRFKETIPYETKAEIADYFTTAELVEYLQIDIWSIIHEFEEEIAEVLDDIKELMGVNK